jgi:hypothetical protein
MGKKKKKKEAKPYCSTGICNLKITNYTNYVIMRLQQKRVAIDRGGNEGKEKNRGEVGMKGRKERGRGNEKGGAVRGSNDGRGWGTNSHSSFARSPE